MDEPKGYILVSVQKGRPTWTFNPANHLPECKEMACICPEEEYIERAAQCGYGLCSCYPLEEDND